MKITDDAILNQVYDGITFDAHERVPFFIVDADSVITVEATEDTEGYTINVADNYYTETLDGVIYAKMGSTHKNKDGSFSGAEPTYSSTVEAQWSELGAAISAQSMMEIRKVAHMWTTLDGAKEIANNHINEYFDNLGEQGFYSNCLGEPKLFDSDAKSVAKIMGQVVTANVNKLAKIADPDAKTSELSWKESGVIKCYKFTDEQMTQLGRDLQIASTTLEHAREELLEAIDNCKEIGQVKYILSQLV